MFTTIVAKGNLWEPFGTFPSVTLAGVRLRPPVSSDPLTTQVYHQCGKIFLPGALSYHNRSKHCSINIYVYKHFLIY